MTEVKLSMIPADEYSAYRYNAIFKAYKWDPQVNDHNTVSRHVVLMGRGIAAKISLMAEKLSDETILMEESLINRQALYKKLGLPKRIEKVLPRLENYNRERNVRLMRFDFHPTNEGWAVSEVNSDVPGGLAEAVVLPDLACEYFGGYERLGNVADSLAQGFKAKIKEGSTVAFVHATSYSDDRQVMQFLSDYFNSQGIKTLFAAPDHLSFRNRSAFSAISGFEGEIGGVVRFFPLEWLLNLPKTADWKGYYNCITPSCNHPISIFAQSKRLPLIWDELDVEIPTWKSLLPETVDPKKRTADEHWIYKPALGRVGEGISIKEAVSANELVKIEKSAQKFHKDWILQRRFQSRPLLSDDGIPYHLCLGVFTVDGKCAGFYGRISPYPRIDANAQDIPVLVEKE